MELSSSDVVLAALPQFHVGGWNIQPLLAWWTGATVVLERRFDAGRVLQLIAERKVTTMMGVPAQYAMLAEHPDFASAELGPPAARGRRRGAHAGAAAADLAQRGVALSQGYGLTEASPNVLCLANEEAARMVGYSGKPYPQVTVAVADPATGEILDGEATGELLVAGPGVFAGYFRNPAAPRQSLAGGWLRTGDLVERDAEGYIEVVDRLKDIYISGGENVAPAEVKRPAGPPGGGAGRRRRGGGRTLGRNWRRLCGELSRPRHGRAGLLDDCAAQLAHSRFPRGSRRSEPCRARR